MCLLAVSALVSGAETSFFSLTPHDIRDIKAHPEKSSNDAILRLLGDVDQLLATILVVNNLVNICIVILAARIINLLFTFGSAGMRFLFESVIATFLLLLFGEIIPKVFAQSRPLRFARTVARPILLMRWLMRPFAYILIRTSSTISEHAARRNEISLDELADAVDMTATASAEEHNMLSGIVKFANTEVQEIMRPRVDVVAVGIGDNYLSVKERIIASGFSRIPVCDEDLDNIKGILYVKDLLPYINNGDEFGWQQLLRKAYFVPEHKKINDLLEEFQSNKVHMAVVVDEYGSTLGHRLARRYSRRDRRRDFGRERRRRKRLHQARRPQLPLRRQDPHRRLRTHPATARKHLRRRQGRGRDAGGADARNQARFSEKGRRRDHARPPFHGPLDRRPTHRQGTGDAARIDGRAPDSPTRSIPKR